MREDDIISYYSAIMVRLFFLILKFICRRPLFCYLCGYHNLFSFLPLARNQNSCCFFFLLAKLSFTRNPRSRVSPRFRSGCFIFRTCSPHGCFRVLSKKSDGIKFIQRNSSSRQKDSNSHMQWPRLPDKRYNDLGNTRPRSLVCS